MSRRCVTCSDCCSSSPSACCSTRAYVIDHAGQVALFVAVIVAGKSLICGSIARAFGYRNMAPWIVGLGLSQIGEFSFVLARAGRTGGFIAEDTYNLALTCTVLSMALSPVVFSTALPIARAWARWRGPRQPPATPESGLPPDNHVIVAGYGRTGRAVVQALQGAGVPYVVVELDHRIPGEPV